MIDFKFTVRHDCSPVLLDSRVLIRFSDPGGPCESLQEAIQGARRAAEQMHQAFDYIAGLAAYSRLVGRPPGSNRTARLRKKRRNAVLAWYYANFKRGR